MNRLSMVRGLYGLVLLGAPGPVLRVAAGRRPQRGTIRVVRVLGLRQLVQATGCSGAPTRPVLLLGVEVDVLHCLSAAALAAFSHSWRRAGLTATIVAGTFAATGLMQAQRAPASVQDAQGSALGHRVAVGRDRLAAGVAQYAFPRFLRRWMDAGL